jgi:flagellar protein FlaG
MAANVGKISAVPLPTSQSRRQAPDVEAVAPVAAAASQDASDYRLVIEEDSALGTFIYKTIDRSTGEVVNQFPREELLRLKDDPAYVAGAVLTTKA